MVEIDEEYKNLINNDKNILRVAIDGLVKTISLRNVLVKKGLVDLEELRDEDKSVEKTLASGVLKHLKDQGLL